MPDPRPSPDDLRALDPEGRFIDRLRQDREAISELHDLGPFDEFRAVIHRLAGAAGTFGYQEVSELAFAVEDMIDLGVSRRTLAEATQMLLSTIDSALSGSA